MSRIFYRLWLCNVIMCNYVNELFVSLYIYCSMRRLKYPLMVKRLACMILSGAASVDCLDILQPASLHPETLLEVGITLSSYGTNNILISFSFYVATTYKIFMLLPHFFFLFLFIHWKMEDEFQLLKDTFTKGQFKNDSMTCILNIDLLTCFYCLPWLSIDALIIE